VHLPADDENTKHLMTFSKVGFNYFVKGTPRACGNDGITAMNDESSFASLTPFHVAKCSV
jgi:hypothetical protein